MAMTDDERFCYDLAGFFVRPGVLSAEEIAPIADQIERVFHDAESLPPEQRACPGGPASLLLDHSAVMDVLVELIHPYNDNEPGNYARCDSCKFIWREQGDSFFDGALHRGTDYQADPIFGYRVQNGRIYAGRVQVMWELAEVGPNDGGTAFVVGSHKANFPVPERHLEIEPGKRSEFYTSYSCPPGSIVFFNENLLHCGPVWQGERPRIAVLFTYLNAGVCWTRFRLPPAVLDSLPPEKRVFFRDPWIADFSTDPPTLNAIDRIPPERASVTAVGAEP